MPPPTERFLAPRDYRKLLSYRKAEIVFDITNHFCDRFFTRGDRTIDQMIQAARSGKQNIAEGSKAGLTSRESEIRLTNVARASLEELLIDFGDFLRLRDLALWDKDSKQARFVRDLSRQLQADGRDARNGSNARKNPHSSHSSHSSHPSHRSPEQARALFIEFAKAKPPEAVANIAICLIHQANYLLDQQLRRLEADFLKKGGLREAMTQARLKSRAGRGGPP
ncbi:hypothetical protein PHYC_03459 [Phycisphaerales bacterium]|nr:hypothetical protein PHYC_03459 [Phycisphaerales bacterium]